MFPARDCCETLFDHILFAVAGAVSIRDDSIFHYSWWGQAGEGAFEPWRCRIEQPILSTDPLNRKAIYWLQIGCGVRKHFMLRLFNVSLQHSCRFLSFLYLPLHSRNIQLSSAHLSSAAWHCGELLLYLIATPHTVVQKPAATIVDHTFSWKACVI